LYGFDNLLKPSASTLIDRNHTYLQRRSNTRPGYGSSRCSVCRCIGIQLQIAAIARGACPVRARPVSGIRWRRRTPDSGWRRRSRLIGR
jgi:hypothetical protein